jgi:hypothetical protein
MKAFVFIVMLLAVTGTLSYMANILLVNQNLIFTHDAFTTSNVPFYDSTLGEGTTLRYRYHWWEFGLNVLRIVPVILSFIVIYATVFWKLDNMIVFMIILAVLTVMESLKIFKKSVDWIRCASFQFCRSYDPHVDPATANGLFVSEFIFTAWFWVLDVIYISIFYSIQKEAEKLREKLYNKKHRMPNIPTPK